MTADLVVVGAGAAGLMAAISAARADPSRRVVAVDSARRLGAKILVSGGARCNVTHERVTERDYAGSTPAAIRRVLRRFTVEDTVRFFRELGVELKREETGKLFPVTDSARTVLDALVRAARTAGVELVHPWRVERVSRDAGGFVVGSSSGASLRAPRVILATGGRSLPKSGSDGHGWSVARQLGHSVAEPVVPALVPLVLADGHFVRSLAGITVPARLELRERSGRRVVAFTGSTLCTHFGLSGPAVLDLSRHWLVARSRGRDVAVVIAWLIDLPSEQIDAELAELGPARVGRWLERRLPDRLASALLQVAGVDAATPGHQLTRASRRALVGTLLEMELPVVGDRGWNVAEATAGGVPLAEVDLHTLESRVCPGLSLCGEMLDVDGRIGGFNFQWAWASGYVAGTGAWLTEPRPASGLSSDPTRNVD